MSGPRAFAVARELGVDPLRYLLRRFSMMTDDDNRKIPLALEIMPYTYPRLKSVDVSSTDGTAKIIISIGGSSVTVPGRIVEGSIAPQSAANDTPEMIENAVTVVHQPNGKRQATAAETRARLAQTAPE